VDHRAADGPSPGSYGGAGGGLFPRPRPGHRSLRPPLAGCRPADRHGDRPGGRARARAQPLLWPGPEPGAATAALVRRSDCHAGPNELWDPEGARRAWLTWGLEDAAWAAGLQAPLEPGPPSPGLPPDADTIGGDSVSTGLNRPYTPPAGARPAGDIGRQWVLLARTIMAGARSAELRVPRVRLLGGTFWLGGILAALVLLPLAPPTRAIGSDGWLLAAAIILAATAVLWRRLAPGGHGDRDEMRFAGLAAVVAIGVLEWLAGGHSSPYRAGAAPGGGGLRPARGRCS